MHAEKSNPPQGDTPDHGEHVPAALPSPPTRTIPVRPAGWKELPMSRDQGNELLDLMRRMERYGAAAALLLKSIDSKLGKR